MVRSIIAAAGLAIVSGPALAEPPARPFPQHVTYASGARLPTNFTQAQRDDHVRAYYNAWRTRFLVVAGTDGQGRPLHRIAFGPPGTPNAATTVSEGQGFGMIIVALMAGHDPDAKTVFDGLWRFARAFPSGGDPRLMTWRVTDGVPTGGNASAFDGDADIALGLLLANEQWPGSLDPHYASAAATLIAAIRQRTLGPTTRLPMLGDWVQPAGTPYNEFTHRTSDLMPATFQAFSQFTGEPAWRTATGRARLLVRDLQAAYAPSSGLLPDFVVPLSSADATRRPADPGFLEGANDGHYFYNACRVPLRIGLDALWTGNATSRAAARKLATWARLSTAATPAQLKAGYHLDGTPLPGSDYLSLAFVAPMGVAAMVDPGGQTFLNRTYNLVRRTRQGYYEDSLALLSLLAMSGNFWRPSPPH